MKNLSTLTLVVFVAVLLSSPAVAEKGGKDHGGKGGPPGHAKGKDTSPSRDAGAPHKQGGPKAERTGNDGPGNSAKAKGGARRFESSERVTIERYYRDTYGGGNCPPGLAKKNNGCMPPGQARKLSAGSRLPDDIVLAPLPSDLHVHIAPPLPGYAYGYYDGYVVLYETGPRVVVDVIVLF